MELISYVSREFEHVADVFDYLAANVPWLTVSGDELVCDNLTLTKSTNNITVTDSVNSTSLTTPTITNTRPTFQVLITDTALIVGQGGLSSFIIGKSTDGENEHYGLITRTSGANNAEFTLTYGSLSAATRGLRNVLESSYTTQFLPVYAEDTAYNIEDAFITIMSTYPAYYGKITLDGTPYVQCGGLALQYTE